LHEVGKTASAKCGKNLGRCNFCPGEMGTLLTLLYGMWHPLSLCDQNTARADPSVDHSRALGTVWPLCQETGTADRGRPHQFWLRTAESDSTTQHWSGNRLS